MGTKPAATPRQKPAERQIPLALRAKVQRRIQKEQRQSHNRNCPPEQNDQGCCCKIEDIEGRLPAHSPLWPKSFFRQNAIEGSVPYGDCDRRDGHGTPRPLCWKRVSADARDNRSRGEEK